MHQQVASLVLTVVLLLLRTPNQASSLSVGKCASVSSLPDFDMSKYVGKWYEIERFNFILELNQDCTTAEYSRLNATHVSVRNSGRNEKTGNFHYTNGYAVMKNMSEPNKLMMTLPIYAGIIRIENTGESDVLETDYTTYSVVYSCTELFWGLKFEMARIYSRTTTLDCRVVENLKMSMRKRGIDVDEFVKVNQESCIKRRFLRLKSKIYE